MRLYLIGNRASVDFANTVVTPGGRGDALRDFGDLVGVLRAVGVLGPGEARRLRAFDRRDPRGCARAFRRALALRAGIRAMLETRRAGGAVEARAVAPINALLAAAEGREALVRVGGQWRRRFLLRRPGPEAALVPIARDAAGLIEEGPGAPVRRCGNPACVLYFYDASRTRRRRWCSMAGCGNRMKVAAHARRARLAGAAT